jgi:hypothetical protein
MHRRREHTGMDPLQHHRLVSGGLDEVWVRKQAVADTPATPQPLVERVAA